MIWTDDGPDTLDEPDELDGSEELEELDGQDKRRDRTAQTS